MANQAKQGFPWLDGQFFNKWLPFKTPIDQEPSDVPNVHVVIAHDEQDGEIRIRLRRLGSHAETNEVDIGISKDGMLTSFDRYDT